MLALSLWAYYRVDVSTNSKPCCAWELDSAAARRMVVDSYLKAGPVRKQHTTSIQIV